MTTERLDLLIIARNEAARVFQEITNAVRAMGEAASSSGRDSGASFEQLVKVGSDVIQVYREVRQVLASVGDTVREGAISQQLGDVLQSYAGSVRGNAEDIVRAAKRASAGTISEIDLMLQANRAFQFEVAKTPESFSKLIELSTALGRAQGISDTQALENLTGGIARESKLILDNLGLVINMSQAMDDYATSIGKTSEMLTSAERKQAILAEAYRQGKTALEANAKASDSAATSIERMDANVKDLKVSLGEIAATGFGQTINDFANWVGTLVDRLQNGGGRSADSIVGELERLRKLREEMQNAPPIKDIFGGEIPIPTDRIEALTSRIAALESQLVKVRSEQEAYNDVNNQTQDGMLGTSTAALQFGAGALQAAMSTRELGAAALDGAEGLSQMEAMAWSTASSLDAVAQAANRASFVSNRLQGIRNQAISQAESLAMRAIQAGADPQATIAQFGDLADQIQNTALSMENSNEATLQNKVLLSELRPEYTDAWEGAVELEKANDRAARSAGKIPDEVRKAQQAYDQLQGKVSGVLGQSLNVDVGVNPDDILPRQDAINENARRVADIAKNGFKSPWLDFFQKEFPALYQEFFAGASGDEGVKLQAARLLKNFQEGLEPELIDKEQAKERVRRMLLGEANMAQLAKEITDELAAEFGDSLSVDKIRATTAAALGTNVSELTDQAGGVKLPDSIKLMFGEMGNALNLQGLAEKIDFSPVIGQITTKTGEVGTSLKTGFISALDGIGEQISSTIAKQLQAEGVLKQMETSGLDNGKVWVGGFVQAVGTIPTQVLEVLASMLSPYVEAINARNATLTGAN